MTILAVVSRVFLLATLSFSAIAKLGYPAMAAEELAALLGLHRPWDRRLVLCLGALETAAALSLLVPSSLAFVPALGLFLLFGGTTAALVANGRAGLPCGCGGKGKLSVALVISNFGLALVALSGTGVLGSTFVVGCFAVGCGLAFGPRLLTFALGYRSVERRLPMNDNGRLAGIVPVSREEHS